MYLKYFKLENIKAFSSIEIDFTSEQDEVRKWTAIYGDNGLGKSSLLRAIAVALAGPGAMADLIVPTPKEWEWVKMHQPYGVIYAEILQSPKDQSALKRSGEPYITQFIVPGPDHSLLPPTFAEEYDGRPVPQEWSGNSDSDKKLREKITKDIRLLKKSAYSEDFQGWLACGYGPFRRLQGGGEIANSIVNKERKSARFVTLFHESAALTNIEEWLQQINRKAKDGDLLSERRLTIVKNIFESGFLPVEGSENIELIVDSITGVRLKVGADEAISIDSLSDGYRSMLAMGVDLVRWLTNAFPDEQEPMKQSGVVLIDELDVHLHPKWQRKIGFWLRKKFPNLQFIVATHSPFLAQVAEEASGNIILIKTPEGIKKRDDVEAMQNWRADQILTDLMELSTTRSPLAEQNMRRFQQLSQMRANLSVEERQEYQELQGWVEILPPALENPSERHLSEQMRKMVSNLRGELEDIK